jgi:hypothetical protein
MRQPDHQTFATAASRRRFYLDVGLRKRPIGSGSNMEMLMQSEREKLSIDMEASPTRGPLLAAYRITAKE